VRDNLKKNHKQCQSFTREWGKGEFTQIWTRMSIYNSNVREKRRKKYAGNKPRDQIQLKERGDISICKYRPMIQNISIDTLQATAG
jgi:hypothetical protein